jgi:hypothetical protein
MKGERVSVFGTLGRLAKRLIRWEAEEEDLAGTILAALTVLQDESGRRPLSIYAIHAFVSCIQPLAERLEFVAEPISYSPRLGMLLDDLTRRDYLEEFVIFDDGYFPQTVYRLTLQGKLQGEDRLARLPGSVGTLARNTVEHARSHREATPQAKAILAFPR